MDRWVPLGGQPIDLAWQFHKVVDGVLYHPGDHPAFAGHIRWGRLEDGRRWVSSSVRDDGYGTVGDWVFDGATAERDMEQAIVELQATRQDGRWVRQPTDPGPLGRPS